MTEKGEVICGIQVKHKIFNDVDDFILLCQVLPTKLLPLVRYKTYSEWRWKGKRFNAQYLFRTKKALKKLTGLVSAAIQKQQESKTGD